MRVRKILYHGTTVLRWNFIKKEGLLRCNMPKSFERGSFERGEWLHNVYLTAEPHEAERYGLLKSVEDMMYLNLDDAVKMVRNYKDTVVLGINAAKLGDHLEKDPEVYRLSVKHHGTEWYKYKGDIKLKDLFVCKYVPFDSFSSDLKNKFIKINEKQFQHNANMYRTLQHHAAPKTWLSTSNII